MPDSEAFCVNEQKVVSETLEGETIIINLETGTYYSLNSIASEIWNMVEAAARVSEVTRALSARYDGEPSTIGEATRIFFESLSNEGLIRSCEPSEAEVVPNEDVRAKGMFVPPELHTYRDMQEMLLADPIHDVDATGWPKLKQESE